MRESLRGCRACLIAWFACAASLDSANAADRLRPAVPGLMGAAVAREFEGYYARTLPEPDAADALDSLAIGVTANGVRAAAARLDALERQSLADEHAGPGGWHPTPYWGGRLESDAHEYREALATAIGARARGPRAAALVTWAFAHEPDPRYQALMAAALPRLSGREAHALVDSVVSHASSAGAVLVASLMAVRSAHDSTLLARVEALRDDYREAVRDTARAVAAVLGAPPLPPFQPEDALEPSVVRMLRDVAARVLPAIPDTAHWCRLERIGAVPRVPPRPWDVAHGWRIAPTDSEIRVVSEYGLIVRWPRATTRIVPETLEQFAAELTERRGTRPDDLSSNGGLTAQFEPRDISLPEADVAAWLYQRRDRRLVAEVLLPRMQPFARLADFDAALRDLAGIQAQHAMLEAFSYDRDYPGAIAWADLLTQPQYAGFAEQPLARELGAQLRVRSDDFAAFALPDTGQWRALRAAMTRAQVIGFLTAHLRLLNSFQHGQPGGVSMIEPQYAGPWHFRHVFDEIENHSARVIQPLDELDSLHLTVDDIPALLPAIGDRSYLPTFGFWRDFSPEREVYRVCGLAQQLINQLAHQPLVDAEYFSTLGVAARRRYLLKVRAWCRAHAAHTARDLQLETLRTIHVQNEFWRTADALARAGDQRSTPIVLRRMDEFPEIREFLVTDLRLLHSAAAVPRARRWVTEPFAGMATPREAEGMAEFKAQEIRCDAALILLQHAAPGTHEGWPALQSALEHDRDSYWLNLLRLPALWTGDSLALAWFCEHTSGFEPSPREWDADTVTRILVLGDCVPTMHTLLAAMASDSVIYRWPARASGAPGPTRLLADRACEAIGSLVRPRVAWAIEANDSTRAVLRPQIERWLRARCTAAEARPAGKSASQ